MAAEPKNDKNNASKTNDEKGQKPDPFGEDISSMEKYDQLINNVKMNPTAPLRGEIILEIFDSIKKRMVTSKDSNCEKFGKNMTVWDFGAGSGVFTKVFLNLIKQGTVSHVIASDLSKNACKYLNKELGDNVKNGELSIINNTTTEIKNENTKHKIDVLWMSFTLHHLEGDDKKVLLKNIKDNLKISGGKLIALEISPQRAKSMLAAVKAEMDKIKQSDATAVAAKNKNKNNKNENKNENENENKKKNEDGQNGDDNEHKHEHDKHESHGDGHLPHDFKTMKDTMEDLEKNYGFKSVCEIDFNKVLKENEQWKKVLEPHNVDLDGVFAVVVEPK